VYLYNGCFGQLFRYSFGQLTPGPEAHQCRLYITSMLPISEGAAMSTLSEALIWIEADGSARELNDTEKKYVDTAFSPFDGARPFIKSRYDQRNGWNDLSGYLQRKLLPKGIPINPPSPSSPEPNTPQSVADAILEKIRKHTRA
jgi:hypothetical protein